MPRVNVPVNTIARGGIANATPVTGDATNNHTVVNNGRTWIEVENTGASSRSLTFHITKLVDGQTPAARVFTIAAGAKRRHGPFPVADYGTALSVDVAHAELVLAAYTLSDR
jgi:hypothetical protein